MRIEDDILDVARLTPRRSAVETDGRVLTFADLDDVTRRWTDQLRRGGLGVGHPVWILLPNGAEFVLALLAVLRAGGVVVPVNSQLTNDELQQLSLSCPPAAVWCPRTARSKFRGDREAGHLLISVTSTGELSIERPRAGLATSSLAGHAGEGEAGVVYLTSGSTGRPKAILLTHANIAWNARATAEAFGLRFEDRTVVCMRMCHSYTLTKQILAHLGVGATLILAPDFFQPAAVLDLMDRARATTVCAVPSMHVMMYEQVCRRPVSLPAMRLLTSGGSPMPERVQLGWRKMWPHVAFISAYGLSEASPCVTALPAERAVDKVGSVGRPIRGVEVRIADQSGCPVPTGGTGELHVRGPGVMAGYLNDPAATARAIRDGWLHTGDMGWMDADGDVYLRGRRDDMILRGGENIYPAEIENALSRHSDVIEAAVVGVPHPVLGQDIAAFVTLRDGEGTDVPVLRGHCLRHLASFKVPREIHVVDKLPRTANGKLCRRALGDARTRFDTRGAEVPAKEFL